MQDLLRKKYFLLCLKVLPRTLKNINYKRTHLIVVLHCENISFEFKSIILYTIYYKIHMNFTKKIINYLGLAEG